MNVGKVIGCFNNTHLTLYAKKPKLKSVSKHMSNISQTQNFTCPFPDHAISSLRYDKKKK